MSVKAFHGEFRVQLTGRRYDLPQITIMADSPGSAMRLQDYLTPEAAESLARQLLNAADAARSEDRERERFGTVTEQLFVTEMGTDVLGVPDEAHTPLKAPTGIEPVQGANRPVEPNRETLRITATPVDVPNRRSRKRRKVA